MLVGLPCLEEGIDTDPCVEKKYTEIITLIKEAEESNDTAEVGYLTKTLMKLIKENTMDEDLIVNEVAYNSATEQFNDAAPYKITDHQIFLHNLQNKILVNSTADLNTNTHPLVKKENNNKTTTNAYEKYKFLIFCEKNSQYTLGDCETKWIVCNDNCCYDFSTIRAESEICISNGSGVGIFTSEDCCCVTELYKELMDSDVDLGLDLSWRVHQVKLLCSLPENIYNKDELIKLLYTNNVEDNQDYVVDEAVDIEAYNADSGTKPDPLTGVSAKHPDSSFWWKSEAGSTETTNEEKLVNGKRTDYWVSTNNVVDTQNKGLFYMRTNEDYRYIIIDQGPVNVSDSDCSATNKNSVSKINVTVNGEQKTFELDANNTFDGISIIDLKH